MLSQLDGFGDLETQLAVNGRVDRVAAFEITGPALEVGHAGNVFDELSSITLASSGGSGAEIDQVPSEMVSIVAFDGCSGDFSRVVVSAAHHLLLGIME